MMSSIIHPMFGQGTPNIFVPPPPPLGAAFIPPPPFYMNGAVQGIPNSIPQSLPLFPPPPPPPPIPLQMPDRHLSSPMPGAQVGYHSPLSTNLNLPQATIIPVKAIEPQVNQDIFNACTGTSLKESIKPSASDGLITDPDKETVIKASDGSVSKKQTTASMPTAPSTSTSVASFVLYDATLGESVEERRAKLQKYRVRS